jgi:hypothetical protein
MLQLVIQGGNSSFSSVFVWAILGTRVSVSDEQERKMKAVEGVLFFGRSLYL